MTIREAAEKWVGEWNAIPRAVVARLIRDGVGTWEELTPAVVGDRVYVYSEAQGGVIVNAIDEGGTDTLYTIELDGGDEMQFTEENFEVIRDDDLPMWGTMWTFGDSVDDWWLESGGLAIMATHGLRIYDIEDLGYCFGVDGAGFSFYNEIWESLYKERGLQWHDEREEATISESA